MNRTNPFDEIEQFFGRAPFGGDRAWGRTVRTTDIDVAEYDDEFVVVADLPGYDRDDIDVRAADGRLTISAERDTAHGHEDAERRHDGAEHGHEGGDGDAGRRYLRRERRHESVTRSVDLPGSVIESEATAAFQNGVLTVTLPKEMDDETDDGHRIDVE